MKDVEMTRLLSEMRAMAAAARGQPPAVRAAGTEAPEFAALLKGALDGVSGAQQKAAQLAEAFEAGGGKTDLSEVMVAMQKANISFQAMVQVRNKLVAAYQEIMGMQV
jgi:flagellar hook-basal body complex protein FliE